MHRMQHPEKLPEGRRRMSSHFAARGRSLSLGTLARGRGDRTGRSRLVRRGRGSAIEGNGQADMAKRFKDLSEQEILALAISSEEDDSRIYGDIAEGLKADYPATAKVFAEMQAEEQEHRRGLTELYRQRFGD